MPSVRRETVNEAVKEYGLAWMTQDFKRIGRLLTNIFTTTTAVSSTNTNACNDIIMRVERNKGYFRVYPSSYKRGRTCTISYHVRKFLTVTLIFYGFEDS